MVNRVVAVVALFNSGFIVRIWIDSVKVGGQGFKITIVDCGGESAPIARRMVYLAVGLS